ncbi:hypothetical protein KTT_10810 [Tengunoibacter tsumagoiensis]|uniref:Uncharacterized protein n=1 Tax=Tengunoibacter tsumagoiensis TaxID=2014871 RepID=A0A401ZWN4_9CHLR|nr:hypothetical protein KTT_10810 [Tengunoibacter tsumagoiensis]
MPHAMSHAKWKKAHTSHVQGVNVPPAPTPVPSGGDFSATLQSLSKGVFDFYLSHQSFCSEKYYLGYPSHLGTQWIHQV